MDQISEKKIFYISSGDQLTGLNSTFSYSIQTPADFNKYDRITILQANIPISYYVVQAGFNTFVLDENGSQVTLTVPEGNYNMNSFSIVVLALLNAGSPNGYTYTMTYSNNFTQTNTGKYTFTVNNASTISIIVSNTTLHEQFGFQADSTNTFVSQSLVSTNVVKFIPEDTIFIRSPILDEQQDVVQEIYNSNSIPFSNLTFLNPDPLTYSKKLKSGFNRNLAFSITNEDGVPLYLNGLNILLTVCFYKSNTIYKKIGKYIEYKIKNEITEE